MTSQGVSSYVRLQVEMVLEVSDVDALMGAAAEHVEQEDVLPGEQRGATLGAVGDGLEGAAEAVAQLVDPIRLVDGAPGVELAQASWSSEMLDGSAARDLAGSAWFEDADGFADRFDEDFGGGSDGGPTEARNASEGHKGKSDNEDI
ncbi:hypothetical protein MTQ01_06495 [Streptomyces sp. XM4193]|uniref:hypothetical protein n=1 Tax=Streptomyces sp. XM4193 TaxID=2929782 RepID=UPI001FF79383|nr:hypothetical protein [Streptomyces sp. XM4193]MCK1795662.1 hypothetical protein [Streptomyces sp. XM4193]